MPCESTNPTCVRRGRPGFIVIKATVVIVIVVVPTNHRRFHFALVIVVAYDWTVVTFTNIAAPRRRHSPLFILILFAGVVVVWR